MDTDKILKMIKSDCESRAKIIDGKRHIYCDGCRWNTICGQDMYYLDAVDILSEIVRIAEVGNGR